MGVTQVQIPLVHGGGRAARVLRVAIDIQLGRIHRGGNVVITPRRRAFGPLDLQQIGNVELTGDAFLAAGLSFIVALMTIFLFMAWLKRSTFGPFVAYRIILGVGLLGLYYGYIG